VLGPAPREVLDPVPRADYVRAMVDGVDGIVRGVHGDTRNGVLTLARMWSTVATDVIRSKDAAADWALARLPADHRGVLAHARDAYRSDDEERWDELRAHVDAYAGYVAAEIRRAASAS
jgi:hypothetical protein